MRDLSPVKEHQLRMQPLLWMEPLDRALWNPDPKRRIKRAAVVGGRRVGKTEHARETMVSMAVEAHCRGEVWYAAPTQHHAKMIQWEDLNIWLDNQPVNLRHGKPNATDLYIPLRWGTAIRLIGMDTSNDRFRGKKLLGFVGDEWDMVKNPQNYTMEIEPSLSDVRGPAVFYSSPRGKRQMYKLWQQGQPGGSHVKDWWSCKVKTPDVGTVPEESLEAARREMTDDEYQQEYLAEFLDYQGSLVPEFINRLAPEGHIIPEVSEMTHINLRTGFRFNSMDYGFSDDTVMLWWWVSPEGRAYIYDSFSLNNVGPEQYAARLRASESPYGGPRHIPEDLEILGDPAMWHKEGTSGGRTAAAQFQDAGWRGLRKAPRRLFWDRMTAARKLLEFPPDRLYPKLLIVEHRAAKLCSQLSMATSEWLNPDNQGFKKHLDCHAFDALLYGAMRVEPGLVPEIASDETPPADDGIMRINRDTTPALADPTEDTSGW